LALDGFVFGLIGTWLRPPDNPVLAAVMVATLLGIAAVALVVLAVSLRASMAITIPVLMPTMLYNLAQADRVSLYLGVGMGVFMALVFVEGRRAAAHTASMLRLQFSSGELAAQRQQALALAERSNAVKSRFLATMSHEMRTPLHGILGLTRLLRDDPLLRAANSSQARLQTLERTGEHLLGLINDVLDYSKIEGGHLRLAREPFDLHALLLSVAELTRVSAAEKGLQLQVNLQLDPSCWVWGDEARLRQVLLNLTGNAVKFTVMGRVTLRAFAPQPGWSRIEVADTGPGVPEADRERIFQAFEQSDGTFARRHGGTGLGLTIAREITQAMGGELLCLDSDMGGALFRLSLPAEPAPAAVPITPTVTGSHGPLKGRVLLAEDNPVNALVAQAVLTQLGLQVVTVTDGERAVEEAIRSPRPYDVVLMDCQMPGVDGFEATARIRQHEATHGWARLPVVALTANALEGDRDRSLQAGMDEHLAKPFHQQQLAEVLRRHLPH
jgi:signal transduction histidine kinase/CheY-like chemotaxis protein